MKSAENSFTGLALSSSLSGAAGMPLTAAPRATGGDDGQCAGGAGGLETLSVPPAQIGVLLERARTIAHIEAKAAGAGAMGDAARAPRGFADEVSRVLIELAADLRAEFHVSAADGPCGSESVDG